MALLVRLTFEGRPVSERPGTNYAPAVFANEREAKTAKVGKPALAEAMRGLFYNKRIRVNREVKRAAGMSTLSSSPRPSTSRPSSVHLASTSPPIPPREVDGHLAPAEHLAPSGA